MNDNAAKPDGDMRAAPHRCGARFPGDDGVWFFIIADMSMFAIFFLLFMVGQAQDPETYRQSRAELSPLTGLANTLILITSGWFMARAVNAGRAGQWEVARRRIIIALVVGSAFAVTKISEYAGKITSGITIQTNEFFTYYFAFTGIHFLHFIVGVAVLLVCLAKLKDGDDPQRLVWLESAASYWHMVDLLWMILFPMLYLAGGTA
jgi:nitric oxide reductase NorE protein